MERKRSRMERSIRMLIGAVLVMCMFWSNLPVGSTVQAAKDKIVLVFDPGHGGESLGADYNGVHEKDLNLIVAKLAKYYLSFFEGVEVILTRDSDIDVDIVERSDIAGRVGADFFYSMHFNASENHTLYGTEVWTSAFGENYVKGAQFGEILLASMEQDMGVYVRGVKTRLKSDGADYYAVIRNTCKPYQIPSVIIEHSFVDHNEDVAKFWNPQALQQFAYEDAIAIAKYWGLKSEVLGLDFSTYEKPEIAYVKEKTPDMTPPMQVQLTEVTRNADGTVRLYMRADEPESSVLYYSYSLDQGLHWSALLRCTEEGTLQIPAREADTFLRLRVYNSYDLYSETADVEIE